MLNNMFELSNVPRPVIGLQRSHDSRRYLLDVLSQIALVLGDEGRHKKGRFLAAVRLLLALRPLLWAHVSFVAPTTRRRLPRPWKGRYFVQWSPFRLPRVKTPTSPNQPSFLFLLFWKALIENSHFPGSGGAARAQERTGSRVGGTRAKKQTDQFKGCRAA